MIKWIFAAFFSLAVFSGATALADDQRSYTIQYVEAEFEDVFQDLQDAILNRGLVIDYVGHVNDMLERTAAVSAEGSDIKSPYQNAKFVQFCSSVLTHEAIRIKPQNLATCPYVLFVYQTHEKPERIAVGYRNPELGIPGPTRFVMEKVDALLKDMVTEVVAE